LNYLALQERPVGRLWTRLRLAATLGLEAPARFARSGPGQRAARRAADVYRTNAEAIRPLHEWTETFERYWRHQLGRVKERAERKKQSINR